MLKGDIRDKTERSQTMGGVGEESEREGAPQKPEEHQGQAWWADMEQLFTQIGQKWPADVSAVDAVREGRRTL